MNLKHKELEKQLLVTRAYTLDDNMYTNMKFDESKELYSVVENPLGISEMKTLGGSIFYSEDSDSFLEDMLNASFVLCDNFKTINAHYIARVIEASNDNNTKLIMEFVDEIEEYFFYFALKYKDFFIVYCNDMYKEDDFWMLDIATLQREIRKFLISYIQRHGSVEDAIEKDKEMFACDLLTIIAENLEVIFYINQYSASKISEYENIM